MAKNKLKWLEVEYCGTADTHIQPVLVNDTVLYTLYDSPRQRHRPLHPL